MEYNIINKEELGIALNDLMPEYSRLNEVEKSKMIDQISETLGSKSTLGMLMNMMKAKIRG